MASFESKGLKMVDKFNGVNFHLWKFKMEMVMAKKELWEIVDGSEEPPPSSSDPKDENCIQSARKEGICNSCS